MWRKHVPFGVAVGLIAVAAVVSGVWVYCQGAPLFDENPVAMPAAESQGSSEKMAAVKTYRNDAYGLEFSYSPEWGDIYTGRENSVEQFYISKNENWVFQLDTQRENPGENEFYNVPKGVSVDDWIIKKQGKTYEDEGDGYFSNKVGSEFDIAGLKTLHLVSRQQQGGSYDEFSFVKDGRLFVLTVVNDASMMEDLKLDDDSQWYTQLLKSFRVVGAQE